MGSILVLSLDQSLVFESIQDLGSNINHAYKAGSQDLGFLSIDSGKFNSPGWPTQINGFKRNCSGKFRKSWKI